MRAKLFIAIGALVTIGWAVPNAGTAPFIGPFAASFAVSAAGKSAPATSRVAQLPLPVRFRTNKNRGLLVDTWINNRGPYVFALDTGAGMNVIAQRVVSETQVTTKSAAVTIVGGLTNAQTTSNREAVLGQLALGDRSNRFPATQTALIVSSLGPGIDGILDPLSVFAPQGFSIDLPNERIEAIDTSSRGLERGHVAGEGAVVPWLRSGGSSRPFVRLGDGRLALVDTGSGFGLAINERNAVIVGTRNGNRAKLDTRDIAGGTVKSRRVDPTTISIGELVLRRVPTDILFGVHDDAPVILGRDALYPFKITFDPRKRLIEFATAPKNQASAWPF